MESKEQILSRCSFNGYTVDVFLQAMEEYAKQQERKTSIAFGEWMALVNVGFNSSNDKWFIYGNDMEFTTTELYNIFLTTQNK